MLIHSQCLILLKNLISAPALSAHMLQTLARADQLVCSQDRLKLKQIDQRNDRLRLVSLYNVLTKQEVNPREVE